MPERDASGCERAVALPEGVSVGHWTDRDAWTGCTVVLGPAGSVSAGEVRGGGPGTREFDLLSPATATAGAEAIVLCGGSAFGLAAADGVVRWLAESGRGLPTPAARVPLVAGAVVYDLGLGEPGARPDAEAGYRACQAAGPTVVRGSVGAGTGCTAGKLLGARGWTKSGLGAASTRAGGALLTAIAVANPFGEVLAADGGVLAGVWSDGGWRRTADLLRASPAGPPPTGQSTTLVCLVTDARLDKTQAWLVARAASAGVARAVSPAATAVDGDLVVCLATGAVATDPFPLSILAAEVAADAIRDAARQATGAPDAPDARERTGGSRGA